MLVTLKVDSQQRWWQDDQELEIFRGLIDIDLGFSPSTNTLPIRRLPLKVGDSAETTTFCVQFPNFEIVTFPQRYTCMAANTYLFESLDSTFKAMLEVNDDGLVTDYETLWYQSAITV